MKHTSLFLIGLFMAALVHAENIADVPLEKCSPGQVLMKMNFNAMGQYQSAFKTNNARWHQLQALSELHPGSENKSMDQLLTKDELADFSKNSDQIAVTNYYLLAESRVVRDTLMMMNVLEANEVVRDGKPIPDAASPDAKRYMYLARMLFALKEDEHPPVKNTAECSLNLALQLEADKEANRVANSKEYRELITIRTKYRMPDGASFDTVKLSPADSKRVEVLGPRIAKLVSNAKGYMSVLNALMYYGDAMIVEYEGQKSDTLNQGAAKDMKGYDALQKARYQSLSPVMQRFMDFWFFIDNDTPSDAVKYFQSVKEIKDQFSIKH